MTEPDDYDRMPPRPDPEPEPEDDDLDPAALADAVIARRGY